MKHSILSIFTLFVVLLAISAHAMRVPTIYQAQLPVAAQSDTIKNQMLPQALTQVLIKVTGNSKILDNPNIKSHLNDASTLVQEFSYIETKDAATPYALIVQFDSEGVNKLLKDAAAPIWGANRPLIFVWMDIETPHHAPTIMDSSSAMYVQRFLKQYADMRGLPVVLPAMDETDKSQVSASDIVAMNTAKLQGAAKRYNGDAVLIIRLVQTAADYTAQAKLVLDSNEWNWNINGKNLSEIFKTLMDNAADSLATRYATVVSNVVQGSLTLKISGVTQQDDFGNMMHYLEHLTPVASVQVMKIDGSDVTVSVKLNGSLDSFKQLISVGKKLTAVPAESNDKIQVYQWDH